MSDITAQLQERILVLDGAMGTMIQAYGFEEEDYRGTQFKDHHCPVKGNNDMLSITQLWPLKTSTAVVTGADIIETNTFSSTSIGMADYAMEDAVYDLNYAAAKIAREAPMNYHS